jgi:hypothetical protein
MSERVHTTAAYVHRTNGAYLIQLSNTELTQDYTTSELVDAASSLTAAKRVAREMATEAGFRGLRWDTSAAAAYRYIRLDGWYEQEGGE